jgi:hypothetical protein
VSAAAVTVKVRFAVPSVYMYVDEASGPHRASDNRKARTKKASPAGLEAGRRAMVSDCGTLLHRHGVGRQRALKEEMARPESSEARRGEMWSDL